MVTEHEVRRAMDDIASSPDSPSRKARSLLRLSRKIRAHIRCLRIARAQVQQSSDPSTIAGFARMTAAVQVLEEDVRDAAASQMERARQPSWFVN